MEIFLALSRDDWPYEDLLLMKFKWIFAIPPFKAERPFSACL